MEIQNRKQISLNNFSSLEMNLENPFLKLQQLKLNSVLHIFLFTSHTYFTPSQHSRHIYHMVELDTNLIVFGVMLFCGFVNILTQIYLIPPVNKRHGSCLQEEKQRIQYRLCGYDDSKRPLSACESAELHQKLDQINAQLMKHE